MPTIKTRTRPDGETVYTFVADVGITADGKRRQQRFTFSRLRDAKAELAKLGYQRPRGEYVPRSTAKVSEILDSYLQTKAGKSDNTVLSYTLALRIPREQIGHRKAQEITRDDIQNLIDYAQTEGRKRGGKPGTGLKARSLRLMIQQLSAAFDLALYDGKVHHNPCIRVEIASTPRTERDTWSAAELRTFLTAADSDRLRPVWRLLACGLRRGELCGLRWSDINWDAATVTIGNARVLVNGKVVEKSPKTARGYRTLPVDAVTVGALRALRDLQQIEAIDATPAYDTSGYVATDELGAAINPERLSDDFHRLAASAGLPVIRMHDVRHTANSLMAAAGVPDHIRAAWCGHTVAVNTSVYTHARAEDMRVAGDALGKIISAA
jgi:integrase